MTDTTPHDDEDDDAQRIVDSGNYLLSRLDYLANEIRAIAGHLRILAAADGSDDDRRDYLVKAAQWASAFGEPGEGGLAGVVRTAQNDVMRSASYGFLCGGSE